MIDRIRRNPWTVAGTVVAVVALAVVAAVVRWLPTAGPEPRLIPSTIAGDEPSGDVLTCERTLPEDPVVPEGADPAEIAEQVEVVGRVSSTQVLACPDLFDGLAVTYVGEVVGDVLRRDGGAWVLMNDDPYALEVGPLDQSEQFEGYNSGLSVWLPTDLARLADEPGRAGTRGDVLRVRGVLHRVDEADGGGLTIRAFDGSVVADARSVRRGVNVPQAVTAGVLVALAAAVVMLERRALSRT